MTNNWTLTRTALTDAGITAEWGSDSWYTEDADGFLIQFGQNEDGYWSLTEYEERRFDAPGELLDYVAEFLSTPANL